MLIFRLVLKERIMRYEILSAKNDVVPQEKMAIVQQSFECGMSISIISHQHCVATNLLFLCVNSIKRKADCSDTR
ncbi:hypothetical protein PROSTU_01043 [Providencia stuartii ATCC 25827]|uniref:Uncharacterized protein n=1 Tax=Providencia stuartii ATCC 25827 TaxID=471874 RepID=A0AA86Z2W1_PROST|nr:hypothetical protein PROSTU_01043 [Providencia stuartii ATCC 25827]